MEKILKNIQMHIHRTIYITESVYCSVEINTVL